MINSKMKYYDYSTLDNTYDDYGQLIESPKAGKIKIAINLLSQTINQSIKYVDCTYIGLTLDNEVNDTYIIDYNGERLKVKYVNKEGRYNQVFLGDYNG